MESQHPPSVRHMIQLFNVVQVLWARGARARVLTQMI
jgi:hypothetical protein